LAIENAGSTIANYKKIAAIPAYHQTHETFHPKVAVNWITYQKIVPIITKTIMYPIKNLTIDSLRYSILK